MTDETTPSPDRSVLVVEDEWLIAQEMKSILHADGYHVSGVARSAEEFLQMASASPPSLVLLDLHLAGGGDGVEVARRLCELSPIPVVIVSGSADAATVGRIVRAIKPAGFVVKPFSPAQLLATVALAFATSEVDYEAGHSGINWTTPAAVQNALRQIAGVLAGIGMVPQAAQPSAGGFRAIPELALLSAREREVVEQLAQHRRVAWVARALDISEHTVRNHLKSVYLKLNVHSQDELLELVLEEPAARRLARG